MRIQSLDLARGFTVLFIPAIHTVLLYSKTEVYTSWLGYSLQFIAEGPGGQLFMVIMGIVFTFKPKYLLSSILNRAGLLLLTGYVLNVLKFVIPYATDLMPYGLALDLQLSEGLTAYWQLFSLGDILHFAGIALVVLHLVYQLKYYSYIAAVMGIAIIWFSPLLWDVHHSQPAINYLLDLFMGQPPRVFFPVLPWIVYPLTGLVSGYFMKQHLNRAFIVCGIAGAFCLVIGVVLAVCTQEDAEAGFYRTGPFETIAHMGIIGLTLFAWHMAALHTRKNHFFQLLEYSSEHITKIYLIQWVLICWLLPFVGYQQLGLWASFGMACLSTLITYTVSWSIDRLKEYGTNESQ